MPPLTRPRLASATANKPSLWLRPLRSTRGRVAAAATFVGAAAVITTVFGLSVVNADNQVAHLRHVTATSTNTAVATALRMPGHKIVTLENSGHSALARFVVLRDGRGFLTKSALPALSARQTYQLWGAIGGQTISLGILGRAPQQSTFTLNGSPRPSRLGISVEPAGGSIQPSSRMLASSRF